jgi:hypothetical protein
MRAFFHWRYSGVFIPLWFATGVGMALANRFFLAYLFFVVFGIWTLCYWLNSDYLAKKKRELQRREVVRHADRLRTSARKHGIALYGVSSLLILITAVCLYAVHLAEIEYILSSREEWLIPANDPPPPNYCAMPRPQGSITMYFGTNTIYATTFPHPVIALHHHGDPPQKIDPKVTLDRDKNGHLALTMDIFDANGDIVAEIDRNHFTVNRSNFKMVRNDRSSLSIVIPHNKEEVLVARYLNPNSFQISKAILRFPGAPVIEVANGQLLISKNMMIETCLSSFRADIVVEAN